MTISDTKITNNTVDEGNGGGLAIFTSLNTFALVIKDSYIESNSASKGGGAYFEFQKTPVSPPYLSYLYNTSIQYNSADTLGGGIFYQGY